MVSVRYKNEINKYLGVVRRTPFKTALTVLVFAVVTIVISILFYAASGKSTNDKCVTGSKASKSASAEVTSKENLNTAYEKTKKYEDECESRGVLGIDKDDTKTKLSQVQYFHDKSVNAYMLGKKEEAKLDAERGLAINSQIKSSERKLEHHDLLVKDMEYVRDGKY
jgi:hypothetical protein